MNFVKTVKNIFFDINRREQFSKQIATILFFIDLAKKYNYLLVLPRFRFLPPERKYLSYLQESEYIYQDFSYFFDIEYLKNYYSNIIEIKDISSKTLNSICFQGNHIIISTTNESDNLFTKIEDKYQGVFNGYKMIFDQKIKKNRDIYKLEEYNSDNIFFDDVLEQIKYTNNEFNDKRKFLVYNNHFHEITNNIINENLSEPYLAVHWRRTDFLLARRNILNVNRNKEYLLNKCKSILEKYNLKYIYLSTDSNNKEEIDYLYNNLPIINIKNNYSNQDFMIIETLLCVNSNVFYGTKTSLFTKNIISLRTINKNNINIFL
jgi:hypothetical protein